MKKILLISLVAIYLLSLPMAFNSAVFAQAPTKTATMSMSHTGGNTVPLDSTREFTVNVNVNTGGSQSGGFDTTITYNAAQITYKSGSLTFTSFYNGVSAGPSLTGSGSTSKIFFGKQGSATSSSSATAVASLVFTVASGVTSTTLMCDSYYSGSTLTSQTADNVSVYDNTGSYDLLSAQPANVTFTFTDVITTADITGLNPTSGTTAGGTSVTITGTNFGSQGSVTFGGTSATSITSWGTTSIVAVSPAHTAGAVYVVVTPSGGTATNSSDPNAAYTYIAPGTTADITGLNPTSGTTAGGTSVTITGTNFGSQGSVTFGGTSATSITSWGTTSIVAVSPAHTAGAVYVVVTPSGGTATNSSDPNAAYTYIAPGTPADTSNPTITNLNPSSGRADTDVRVVITGTNFKPSGLTTGTVRFGTAPATIIDWTDTQITVWAPRLGAINSDVTYPVTVARSDGKTATSYYTYLASVGTGGTGGGEEETAATGMPVSGWAGLITLNGFLTVLAKRKLTKRS